TYAGTLARAARIKARLSGGAKGRDPSVIGADHEGAVAQQGGRRVDVAPRREPPEKPPARVDGVDGRAHRVFERAAVHAEVPGARPLDGEVAADLAVAREQPNRAGSRPVDAGQHGAVA